MDPLIIIGGLSLLAIDLLKKLWAKNKRRNAQMEQLFETLAVYAVSYKCDACDQKMIEDCKRLVNNYFPYGIEETFSRMGSIDEKKTYALHLINEAASIMQVNLDGGVEFYESQSASLGVYGEQTIKLNSLFLEADPVEFIQTIFHELKHGVQHQALEDNRWGYSDEKLALWYNTMVNYKNADICFEAYDLQSIEVDANKFADEVIGRNNDKQD